MSGDKRFAMTGIGGYIAPRHLEAIRATGNTLVAACDPFDSVGIMDRYFMDARFFTEFERFDRHLEKLRRRGDGIDYLSVCSPNHLHDAHARLALRVGADVICEKPLVLSPWNLDALQEIEQETGHRIYNVLQLRLHPSVQALREHVAASDERHQVDLSYITSRGRWYFVSWKGQPQKSGGIVTNIGIHFFDMLLWVFGDVRRSEVYLSEENRASGHLELAKADVRWHLSLDPADLPAATREAGQTTYRAVDIDGQAFEFSQGFTDLHTRVYEDVLSGGGFGIDDARPAVELAYLIRTAPVIEPAEGRSHPILTTGS
ncbi:oxidoreductase [bacterium]|nr:oxidoreductase [bacterium]